MNYDRVATAVSAVHETFVADLRSLHMGLRMAGKLNAENMMMVRLDMRRALTDYLNNANQLALGHLDEVYAGDLSGRQALAQRMVLVRPLREIALGEIQQLNAKIRGAGMTNLVARAGPLAQLAKKADERFAPTAVDSAGRTWKAEQLVRFLARDFAYQTQINATMVKLQEQGDNQGQVVYLDPHHANHGLVIELPITPAIRALIFHPNANAQLVQVTHVPA